MDQVTVHIGNICFGPVTNTRTNLTYSTIQSAIDDTNTNNGDTITVAAGNYTENVNVYKSVTIEALGLVNVNPLDPTQPIFTIKQQWIHN